MMSKENPILLLMLCEKRFSQERKKSQSKMVLLKLSILYFNKPLMSKKYPILLLMLCEKSAISLYLYNDFLEKAQ